MNARLKAELLEALESWGVEPAEMADEQASLLGSGLLDSLALFNLSLWLEERVGHPIDPTRFDVTTEWDSVRSILQFIERQAAATSQPADMPAAAPAAAPAVLHRDERYRIVRYSPEHRQAVAALMGSLWSPDWALNEAVFRWKYEENPFAGDVLVYLALRDGVPVGMRAFAPSCWEAGAATASTPLYVADDFVVAEADRNHGLFHLFTEAALADLRARGAPCFLSMSALRVTRLQLLASGSHSVGVLPTIALRPAWLRGLDRLADAAQRTPLLWRLAARLAAGRPARAAFEQLDAMVGPVPSGEGDQIELRSQVPAAELADFVSTLPQDDRIRHRRDEAFFHWRYRNPLHAYRFLVARRHGRISGYIVLQRGLSSYADARRINLVDWACESDATLAVLIETAQRMGGITDLVTWRCNDAGPAAVFERLGFRTADLHQAQRGLPCILVRAVQDGPAANALRLGARPLLDAASWDLRMAYTSFA